MKSWVSKSTALRSSILALATFVGFGISLMPAVAAAPEAHSAFAYGPFPEQKLTICRPQKGQHPSPGVLLFHGGGWIGGKASALQGRCEFFAYNGFVAAIVSYRLAGSTARWPAQADDAEAALRWLREHAKNLDLDQDRICAYGESAGGHIALWLGASGGKVACIVDAFGPTDLTTLNPKVFHHAFEALFGSGPDMLSRERNASPLFKVSASFPPVLIIQGEGDQLVPAAQSTKLLEALVHAGTPAIAIMYSGKHSWLGVDAYSVASIMSHVVTFMKSAPRVTKKHQ